MLVAYLSSQLTEQLHILANTSEKVRLPEVTHYFYFLRSSQGYN